MTIRIVTDSTCDIPKETADELGITVVPVYVNIGELSFLDGIDHGIDFDIDYENEKVVCFPDNYKEPYDVSFGAIKQRFKQAKKKEREKRAKR